MDIQLDSYNKAIRIKGIVAHAKRLGIGIKFKEIITILQSEDGEHLFESSLKVGDVVLYHVNFRLEIVLLTVIKEK
jgi:hypothetical protein